MFDFDSPVEKWFPRAWAI